MVPDHGTKYEENPFSHHRDVRGCMDRPDLFQYSPIPHTHNKMPHLNSNVQQIHTYSLSPQLNKLALICDFINVLYLPSYSSLSMHFPRKSTKNRKKNTYNSLTLPGPQPRGEDLGTFLWEPAGPRAPATEHAPTSSIPPLPLTNWRHLVKTVSLLSYQNSLNYF